MLKPFAARTSPDWLAYVSTLAGNGLAGTVDGAAHASRFSDPYGVAIDAKGDVYVADGGDSNRIRRIAADGVVSTFAGGREGFADGAGANAAFNTPSSLAFDRHGNLYVADTGNHAIRLRCTTPATTSCVRRPASGCGCRARSASFPSSSTPTTKWTAT